MRLGLFLGIGSLLTAFAIGAIHQAFTGDASIVQLAMRGVIYATVLSLVMTLRFGMPLSWQLRLRARPGARAPGSGRVARGRPGFAR